MNYYDLLKQYVSNGSKMRWGQFEKIMGKRDLVKSYFRGRSGGLEYEPFSGYEIDFLIANPEYFKIIGKKGLYYTMRNLYDDRDEKEKGSIIANEYVKLYRYDMDEDDVTWLWRIPGLDDFYRGLYHSKPELFKSDYVKANLVRLGIMDRSDANLVFELIIDQSEIIEFFNTRDHASVSDILGGGEWICDDGGIKVYEAYEHASSDNKYFIDRYTGVGDDLLINIIRDSIRESVYDNCLELGYRAIKDGLSYYGEVKSFGPNGAKVLVDISKFKLNPSSRYCQDGNLKCIFYQSFYNGYIKKPRLELNVVDWDKFNRILASKLDEMEASS
jgi:hypothetical protein